MEPRDIMPGEVRNFKFNQINKKMKVKNGELVGLVEDLTHLVQEKIKLKVKGEIYLLIEHLKPLIDSFEKVRKDFVKEHGKGNEKTGYSIAPKDWEKLSKETKEEWEEVNSKENTVNTGLTLDMFEDIESEYPYVVLFKVLK